MVSATLDMQPVLRPSGAPIDPLWHWCAFPQLEPTGALGADGHAPRGGFLPPVALPRRMWAGGSVTFHADIHVDEPLTRVSRIASVAQKQGRAGPMVFVAVTHDISGRDGLAVTERHDIVYLDIPDRFQLPPAIAVPVDPVAEDRVEMSVPLLFRYSAATFNTHRIHYDLDHVRNVEGYPGLVVHGPLQATLMMRLACRVAGRAPRQFDYRGVSPVFHDTALRILAFQRDGDGLSLCTAVGDQRQAMQAQARWDDPGPET